MNINMSKTISTIIKTSLASVGMMSGVAVRGFDPATLPLVGQTPDHTLVYGPYSHNLSQLYVTAENMVVENIADQWLYSCGYSNNDIRSGIFAGAIGELFDRSGNPLQYEGSLADGRHVYKLPEQLKGFIHGEFIALGETFPCGCNNVRYAELLKVRCLHGHLVYDNYKRYNAPREAGSAYFDGRQWVNEKTGGIYDDPKKMYGRSYAHDRSMLSFELPETDESFSCPEEMWTPFSETMPDVIFANEKDIFSIELTRSLMDDPKDRHKTCMELRKIMKGLQ
ncbi:MAG: hypothetical protein LBJ78_02675 [Puniceicoccales bacterium]|jgi:hypothetical protein|nr:hypothetical protein [Puniceicoccales bacterium]